MQQRMCDKRHKKYRTGFTLFEIMVVLGLVVILTTATAVYNKGISKQIIAAREHAKVLGMLVKARAAGFTIPKAAPGESICGYGVHVDPATLTLTYFKDLGAVGVPCSTSANNSYDGVGERIEQIILDSNLTMVSDMTDIVFMPPFGTVLINNNPAKVSATVAITSADAGVTKNIKINAFGQITE